MRTYIPVAAGVGKMPYRHFVKYNVVGALLWGVGVTLLGYFLGQIDFVAHNIEPILIVIVFLSLLPMVIEVWRARRGEKAVRNEKYDEDSEREAVVRRQMDN